MPPGGTPLHTVVVGCLVRNSSSHILLIRHHRRGWEIPQGRVEEGENLIEALRREVREEAGIEIIPGPLGAVWSMTSPPPALIFTFLGSHLSGDLAVSGDSEEAGWFTDAEAVEKVSGSVMRGRLRTLLDFTGTALYRSYTVRPYQVLMEYALGTGDTGCHSF